MEIIRLPIDTKSLYFNIKNDNLKGHTPTVATPLKKIDGSDKLENILLIKDAEIDISNRKDLVELLVKNSKTKVIIKNVFSFKKLTVNGKNINCDCCFGCYIKEEVDETKVQFGRLKLHYPSKFVYEDADVKINNKEIYKRISAILGEYAFIIRAFKYNFVEGVLDFDALIIGENGVPYSKVFINEKGTGNKFNLIFNEVADDYDREIIALKKEYKNEISPYNYLEYIKKLKVKALNKIQTLINKPIEYISEKYPYSLFDFYYYDGNFKKYGILRVTATKTRYFNLSFIQQVFLMNNKNEASIFMASNVLNDIEVKIFNYEDLPELSMSINSIKYEEN